MTSSNKRWRSMSTKELAALFSGPNQVLHTTQEPQGGDSSYGKDSGSYTPTGRTETWPFKAAKPKPAARSLADKIAYKAPVLAPWPEHVDFSDG